jgi:hypothetical protein
MPAEDIRADRTALMSAGMPAPARRLCRPTNTPHFIHCGRVNLLDDHLPGVS